MPNTNTTLTDLFEDIADAIRGKDGTSAQITASDFPTRITAIPSGGGGVPAEALVITGDCDYRFYKGGWDWFITQYGNQITTNDIESCTSMFEGTSAQVPFTINLKSTCANTWAFQAYLGESTPTINITNVSPSISQMFSSCSNLKNIGTVNVPSGFQPTMANGIFSFCNNLRELPSFLINVDFSYINTHAVQSNGLFSSCYSLRNIPNSVLNKCWSLYTSGAYGTIFDNCNSLDKIEGLFPVDVAYTSNQFINTFLNCNRINKMVFATNNGTPYVRNWKGQIIDLSTVGYAGSSTYKRRILNYNSGITADKEVNGNTSYNALKNDPDWFTANVNYARYNHDSAVETINSLPDVSSSGGTNTIKFRGTAGSSTDGGAINTLTTAEIAVATAKGWTVTLT